MKRNSNANLVTLRGELTQEQVANGIGISRSHYAKIERGVLPSLTVAARIANYYGTTIDNIWPTLAIQESVSKLEPSA